MAKKGKLSTPEWIIEGYDSKEAYEKAKGIKKKKKSEKTYIIKICPECRSDNVKVVLGKEEGKGAGEWECGKCKWKGKNVDEKEVSEDEFLEIMEKKGE